MQIELADKNMLIKYKDSIIAYIEDVLLENDLSKLKEEIEIIYNNMCDFLKNRTAIILFAIENDILLGFIWAYKKIVNNGNRLHINYFVVNCNCRGNGIGQKLINKLYSIANKEKIQEIELLVTFSNKKALKFYEKQGFLTERISLCKRI